MTSLFKELGIRTFRIDVTSRCNFDCVFCPTKIANPKPLDFDLGRAKELLTEVSTLGQVGYISFTLLGEPLMYPAIFELLHHAHSLNLRTYIVTNGSLFSLGVIEKLIKTSPSLLKISLISLDEENFASIRGTPMSYARYLGSIRNLLKARIEHAEQFTSDVRVDVAINPRNNLINRILGFSLGEKSVEMDSELLAKRIYSFVMYLREEIPSIEADEQQLRRMLKRRNDLRYATGALDFENPIVTIDSDRVIINTKIFQDLKELYNYHKAKYAYCRPKDLIVNINGDVTLCCQDWQRKNKLGNVFENSIKEILSFNQEVFEALWNGKPPFDFCYRCRGAPTFRGATYINLESQINKMRLRVKRLWRSHR